MGCRPGNEASSGKRHWEIIIPAHSRTHTLQKIQSGARVAYGLTSFCRSESVASKTAKSHTEFVITLLLWSKNNPGNSQLRSCIVFRAGQRTPRETSVQQGELPQCISDSIIPFPIPRLYLLLPLVGRTSGEGAEPRSGHETNMKFWR